MPHFFCRLSPPRPTFAHDMDDDEAAIMQRHGLYWSAHMEEGKVVVFGAVGDPAGPWGALVLDVDDEASARDLTAGDPAVVSGRGFGYDVFPMLNAVAAMA